MLNAQEWWNVIRDYNSRFFPLQFILMGLGIIVTIALLCRNNDKTNKMMKAYLGICNLWMGIVFFILSDGFTSPMKESQGGLFVAIGTLFIVDIFRNKTVFAVPKAGWQRGLMLGLLGLVALYPVVGLVQGHSYDELIYVGMLPCATTALALVLFAMAERTHKIIYLLLLVWALPFPLAVQVPKYGVYEDLIMFTAGVWALVMLVIRGGRGRRGRLDKAIFEIKKDDLSSYGGR